MSINEPFNNAFQLVYSATTDLAQPALFFLLLSIFLNRKQLNKVLLQLLPSGWWINYLVFLLDFLWIAPLATLLFTWLSETSYSYSQFRYIDALPNIVILVITIFLGDLIGYVRHRLEHTSALWPMHLFHHSDSHMSWLTLFRIHPLNRLITTIFDNFFLFFCGIPIWAILANAVFRHYYGMLIHANLPWTYGWLGNIFVSPAMHRWHHVMEGKGIYSNYATVFSLFDKLFGTYYVPGPCKAALGVNDYRSNSIRSLINQLLHPFIQWPKLFFRGWQRPNKS